MMYEFRRLILKQREQMKEDLEAARRNLPSCVLLLKGQIRGFEYPELFPEFDYYRKSL